jgi:hypothetical protein
MNDTNPGSGNSQFDERRPARHHSRPVLKQVTELNRKLAFNLNTDTPVNITFRESNETGRQRIYFLANNWQTRESTLKFVDIEANTACELLNGQQLMSDYSAMFGDEKTATLTKEEQLLRERQRCSNTGITAYCLDHNSERVLFSDRSELFYFDDRAVQDVHVTVIKLNQYCFRYLIW